MPYITVDESPLAPSLSPVEIHYRDQGAGAPLLFLHGGWGYQIYPFDRQIERAVLWGHSDGAVIAAMIGLTQPARVSGLILEAFHFYRKKPGSREFFETMAGDPALLGERVATTLSSEHGEDYWRKLIVINGDAWLRIADEATHPFQNLYDGELSNLRVPALF